MRAKKRNARTSAPRRRKVPEDAPSTVAGVGASAGGLEAFRALLKAVPESTGMAFVFIQHMDPSQESHLKELLSRETKMPVEQVADGMRVRANHVYVIPPNKHMVIRNGALHLVSRGDSQARHNPIDHFFESLAKDRGSNAIGVVLSGTASDGTRGLQAIKAEGGITFAQDEQSAGYSGMPLSAIAAGCVDSVLSPERIARELVRLSRHPYVRVPAHDTIEAPSADGDTDLDKIYSVVRSTSGIDLRYYKPATIRRRIARRMTLLKVDSLAKYYAYLRKNASEVDELCADVFIHVTGFFRDPDSFETLRRKVFPKLLALFDVDAIKKALNEAEDARDFTQAVIETIHEPLVVLDSELHILNANPAFNKAFDYTPLETQGRTLFDLEGGAWNIPRLRGQLLDILPKNKELSDFEFRQVFPKIGERQLLLNARQIYREGIGRLILLAIEDVTERRNVEQAAIEGESTIRALLNSTSQAILAVDAEGKIRFHNLGAERMFGYSSSELVNLPLEELLPERHRTAHVAHRGKYFTAPQVRAMGTGMQLTGRRKDASEFPIDVGLSSVDNAHGPLAVAFIEDVTSLRKATAELRAHEAELRALTARLISMQESNNRVLARELHDDFSQKLAALSMDVTTIANQPPNSAEALRKRLTRVAEDIGKAAGDIHQFSRQLHPSILDDLGLPAALKAECAAFSEQHTTPCEFIAEGIPDSIPQDVALCLYRVAQEALRNVGKHAEAKRVEVRLTGRGDEIELAVVDFGNGFDLDMVKTAKGLGLVSMEERARMVNGQFSITSTEGQGTSVVVRAPLSRS